MERVESLINSLKNNYENGVEKAQLLNLLDQIRHELVSTTVVSDHTNAPVSVWLPAGYQHQSRVAGTSVVAETNKEREVVQSNVHQNASLEKAEIPDDTDKNSEVNIHNETKISIEALVKEIGGVPKPPIHIIEEQEEIDAIIPNDEELVALDKPIVEIEESDAFDEKGLFYGKNEVVDDIIQPQIFELSVDVPESDSFVLPEENEISIPPGFLVGDVSPVAMITKPKELHELLANRVVAKEESVKNQSRILADTLSATKIHDLKKSIGINDRFRFIKSLFRGDESLFDRSVKTINNFNILPEAEYWMQRELVIKLGWNEEDELVQQFYNLVNRRFL